MINALEELGFEFYKSKKIQAIMIKGASVNIECKLLRENTLGPLVTIQNFSSSIYLNPLLETILSLIPFPSEMTNKQIDIWETSNAH